MDRSSESARCCRCRKSKMIKENVRGLRDRERHSLQRRLKTRCPFTGRGTANWALIWAGCLVLVGFVTAGLIALSPHPVVGGVLGGILRIGGIICFYALMAVGSGCFHWRGV